MGRANVELVLLLIVAHQALTCFVFSSNLVNAQLSKSNGPSTAPVITSPFVQHSSEFWAFDRATNSWRPTDLSCFFSNSSWLHSSCRKRGGSSADAGRGRESQIRTKLPKFRKQTEESSLATEKSKNDSKFGDSALPKGGDSELDQNPISKDGDMLVQLQKGNHGAGAAGKASKTQNSVLGDVSSTIPSVVPSRVSMVKFSDVSIWITGHSGAIYERFWNGVQWVVIPHDLPPEYGRASSLLSVNRTMVAMSENGALHQLQIGSNGQLLWVKCGPWLPTSFHDSGVSSSNVTLRKFGAISADSSALYFAATDGSLTELSVLHPTKWINHNHPRGGDIAAVADAGTLRSGVIFTVSTSGDLYEYDSKAKPAWKKHVRHGSAVEELLLAPASGVAVHGLAGAASVSLFLVTKDGFLVERRFHQSKWRWIVHSIPDEDDMLSLSLGPHLEDFDANTGRATFSMFLTTMNGILWEYKITKPQGIGTWVDHEHPFQTPLLSSIPGISLSDGQVFFPLVDGRLGELHVPGLGGGSVGPMTSSSPPPPRDRKQSVVYTWSVLEAPETEGGNAEYCSSNRGSSNCLEGTKDSQPGWQPPTSTNTKFLPKRRSSRQQRGKRTSRMDLVREASESSSSKQPPGPGAAPWNCTQESLFQLRTMQSEKSIFFIGRDGTAFERFFSGEAWLWLKHEHVLPLAGVVGIYSGGVFVVDVDHNLFLRERIGNVLHWLNCSAMNHGRKVISGPPWDRGLLGDIHKATMEDALFLVDQDGNLMEFLVAVRQFVWRDCGHPSDTQVARILDQETLRWRVIFVVGTNGQLYHFNRVTRHWISHHQPTSILLSPIPGTVIRPNMQSTRGSLFLRTEDGGLIEFHWDTFDGWKWTEHGFPGPGVTLVTSPGPSVGSKRLFAVGSDGNLYSRFWDETRWSWIDHGHPNTDTILQAERNVGSLFTSNDKSQRVGDNDGNLTPGAAKFMDVYVSFSGECSLRVGAVRPIALSSSVVMVLVDDGRVASMKAEDESGTWKWISVHDTPTSTCEFSYWAATSPRGAV